MSKQDEQTDKAVVAAATISAVSMGAITTATGAGIVGSTTGVVATAASLVTPVAPVILVGAAIYGVWRIFKQ